MKTGHGTLQPQLAEIQQEVVDAVLDVCDEYACQQSVKKFLFPDVVHASIGKALLYAGARYLGEAIGETDLEKVTEPVEQCLRRYWRMADAICKEKTKECKTHRN